MRCATLTLVCLLTIPLSALSQITGTLEPDEVGRILLEEGVEGLQAALQSAGVPPMTFNRETQVRPVYDAHVRVLDDLLEANGGSTEAIQPEIDALREQLFLAALKFLNPAQRTGLIGAAGNAEFNETNTDLPEDEAELLEYLTDLRSPAGTEDTSFNSNNFRGGGGGGGGGGGLIIDGFSGGRMPNRDEIQEIRINENSFTAEHSSQTRGRTEVITRGGIGRFNGDVTFNFGDESLDARNAFAGFRPPYQQRNFVGNASGPVIPNRLTMTFSVRNNNSETGQTLRAITPGGLVDDAIVRPQVQRGYTTRATLQLSENNNINTSYEFGSQLGKNQNVGEFGLPSQGNVNSRENFTFQIKETAVLSARLNNEVRFQHSGFLQDADPLTEAPHIDVRGAFRAGGSPNKRESKVRQYDFGNLLHVHRKQFGIAGGVRRGIQPHQFKLGDQLQRDVHIQQPVRLLRYRAWISPLSPMRDRTGEAGRNAFQGFHLQHRCRQPVTGGDSMAERRVRSKRLAPHEPVHLESRRPV